MSALGGVVCNQPKKINSGLLFSISRSMIMRGIVEKDAYINDSIGMVYNSANASKYAFQRQPLTLTRNQKNYTLAVDGWISGIRQILSPLPIEEEISMEELILEAYLSLGIDFLGALQGSFALSIFDEERGELLLARDREGSRPLFYTADTDSLAFASEIKALFRFSQDSAIVPRERLQEHLHSPCGRYRPEELYPNIYAIPAGHCGIFSRMGMHIFPYSSVVCSIHQSTASPTPFAVPFYCPDQNTLKNHLITTLFAFDYPQFDAWIPSVFHFLEHSSAPKDQNLIIEDPILCQSISYAYERADRLGSYNGFNHLMITASENTPRIRDLKKNEPFIGGAFGRIRLCSPCISLWRAVERNRL